MPSNKSLKNRFDALDSKRNPVLFRAREFAELSIPGLLPREGMSETSELPVPFSAATARGIGRLSSRLVSTVSPLNNIPFFNLELDDAVPLEGSDPTPEQSVLGRIERRVMKKLGTTNLRSALFAAFQHLQVIGNVLLQVQDNYNLTVHRLDNYVIRRRPDGEWHEIIYRDWVDPSMLPDALVAEGFAQGEDESAQAEPVYTCVINDHKGGCSIEREFRDKKFGKGDYKVCPYIPLGWNLISGENYHRGLIEENLGDIRAIEVMAEALLDAIAANAEWRFGVNPAGITEIHDLQDSVNGAFVPAAKDDVFPIQLGNQAQVAAAQNSVTLKEQTLGQVFLLNSAVQPSGDRVTATMVKVIANELEQALGGVFSDIARSLQLPLVRRVMYMMLNDGILLPESDPATAKMKAALEEEDGVLSIKIRTGLEALNREVENEKMGQIMDVLGRLPQPAQDAVIWPGMLNRFVSTFGVEPTGIIKTVQQMEQEAAQAAQAQASQMAAEQQLQTTGKIAEQAAAA
jgi:hypothetical protein